MIFSELLQNSIRIINDYGEINLAYLYGEHLKKLPHLQEKKVFLPHSPFRALAFLRYVLSNYSKQKNKYQQVNFLFFGDTSNQLKSLSGTIESLQKLGEKTAIIRPLLFADKTPGNQIQINIKFTAKQILISLILLVLYGPRLYLGLRKSNKHEALKFFNIFLGCYIFTPFFLEALSEIAPLSCITSNDHSIANRTFLAVAKHLKIKTMYMQHASVSNLFPKLDVDYAFLDGMQSLKIYESLESIENSRTKIYLTGQKKIIHKVTRDSDCDQIAIAVNDLDDIDKTLKYLNLLLKSNYSIKIRTHPSQYPVFMEKLLKYITTNPRVTFSNPRLESLDSFFANNLFLIAGNSSIHLEAIIAGLPSYFYDFSNNKEMEDYYGYLKHGLISYAPPPESLHNKKTSDLSVISEKTIIAAKFYSATLGTKWEGREGELTAKVITQLFNKNSSVRNLFSIINGTKFRNSYQLKEND